MTWLSLHVAFQYGLRRPTKPICCPEKTKPVVSLCREVEMSLSLFTAVDDIRETATKYRLPGPKKKLLWATILAQVAKQDSCDGFLADLLLDIIRDYLKRPTDQQIISMWLETETGGGDDPDELLADSGRARPHGGAELDQGELPQQPRPGREPGGKGNVTLDGGAGGGSDGRPGGDAP